MKARFVGKNSCGFIHGHSYCIYSKIGDDRLIWIYDKNSRSQCPYQSLESFLANWKPLSNFKKSLTAESHCLIFD